MNCAEWEERIALYAGGDLAAESGGVERHLAECGNCREFERGVHDALSGLQEAHAEPVEAVDYAVVRSRVLAEIDGPARRGWGWQWAWAGGLAAVAAVGLAWLAITARPAPVPAPPIVVRAAIPRAPIVQVTRRARPRLRRQLRRARPAPSEPARPLMVKLVTDDPNVVIYWIAEKGGE